MNHKRPVTNALKILQAFIVKSVKTDVIFQLACSQKQCQIHYANAEKLKNKKVKTIMSNGVNGHF